MVKNGHQSCSNMFKYGENQTFYHILPCVSLQFTLKQMIQSKRLDQHIQTWLNMVFNKKHRKTWQTRSNILKYDIIIYWHSSIWFHHWDLINMDKLCLQTWSKRLVQPVKTSFISPNSNMVKHVQTWSNMVKHGQ